MWEPESGRAASVSFKRGLILFRSANDMLELGLVRLDGDRRSASDQRCNSSAAGVEAWWHRGRRHHSTMCPAAEIARRHTRARIAVTSAIDVAIAELADARRRSWAIASPSTSSRQISGAGTQRLHHQLGREVAGRETNARGRTPGRNWTLERVSHAAHHWPSR